MLHPPLVVMLRIGIGTCTITASQSEGSTDHSRLRNAERRRGFPPPARASGGIVLFRKPGNLTPLAIAWIA